MADEFVIIAIVLVVVVVAIAGAALMMRKKKIYCPSCGYRWREGAMACMSCKYSPLLPPAHVAIDTSSPDFGPSTATTTTFVGDARDPWVRRNF